MTGSLIYSFSDLPLIIDGAFTDTTGITGAAEVEYFRDGTWLINSVAIQTTRVNHDIPGKGRFTDRLHWLSDDHPVYAIIVSRLESEWHGKVDEAVAEHIEEARQYAAETRAEHRRDLMAGV